ncbi:MAG: PQQ-binding-like beta-propeller repeat protein [Thermoguttaceae bacterium]
MGRPRQFLWSFPEQMPPEEKAMPLCNAPAIDADRHICLHVHDRLVTLEERNSRPVVLWEYVTGGRVPGPVVFGQDGNLRFHCSDGCLHCINLAGKQVWPPVPVGQPLGYAAPMVDDRGNTFLSAFDGGLIRVDPDGRVRKSGRYFRSREKFNSAGVIRGGVLYIGAENGYVFAIELGDEKGVGLWNHVANQGHTGWYIHCWPAITDDGVLVVAGRDECLYGFAPDGSLLWKTPMPGQMLGSPVVDRNGHVYAGISQLQRGRQPTGLLVCLDGNSHKVRWEYRAAGPVESTPVIGDDDVIYFGDNSGQIHAVDFSGRAAWTAQLETPVRSAGTIFAPNRLLFGLDNETAVVLECSASGLAHGGWPKIGRTLGQG